MLKQLENGNYEFNLSTSQSYYSQKNNELDPLNTCSTTSMLQALEISGYIDFPKGKYKQPEDNLTYFLRTDKKVLDYYKKNFYTEYSKWNKNPTSKEVYQPNEIHNVLSYGTNLWMGKEVTKFVDNFSINDIPNHLIETKTPLIMSGLFGKLHHVIDCVGIIIKKSSYEKKQLNNLGFFDCEGFIFDDTYGYTFNYKDKSKNGNNIIMNPKQLITLFKSLDNPLEKWCHIILK